MKKKAQTFNILTFMIFAFLVVVFFGGLIYAMGKINDALMDAGAMNEANSGQPGYTNMTQATISIFGQLNSSIQALKMVALVYILAIAVIVMVTNALMKIHPIFFIAYVLLVLLAVIFAPTISNAYETLLASNIYEGGLTAFTASNYILRNLPIFVAVIGLLGGIFLFVNLIRGNNEGSLGQ